MKRALNPKNYIPVLVAGVLLTGCSSPEADSSPSVTPSSSASTAEPSPTKTSTPKPKPTEDDTDDFVGLAVPSTETPKPEPKRPEDKPQGKTVALTFDDGPSAYTPEIMSILKEHEVKATFFVIGSQAEQNPDVIKELKDHGMSVQSHTYAHMNLLHHSDEVIKADLEKTSGILRDITGEDTACMRPPYGDTDARTDAVANRVGLDVQLWDIDTEDWKTPDAQSIVTRVADGIAGDEGEEERVERVLMHDGGGNRSQTVAALPDVIKVLKDDGYKFVTIC